MCITAEYIGYIRENKKTIAFLAVSGLLSGFALGELVFPVQAQVKTMPLENFIFPVEAKVEGVLQYKSNIIPSNETRSLDKSIRIKE